MCIIRKPRLKINIPCKHHLPNIKDLVRYQIYQSMRLNPYYNFFFEDRFNPKLETIHEIPG